MSERNNPNIIRDFRVRYNLSQEDVAEGMNTSQKRISEIENGKKRITPEMAKSFEKQLKAFSTVRAQVLYELKTEFVNTPYLNGVDRHIQTVLDSVIEECNEAIIAANRLKKLCKNKLSAIDLSTQERFELMELLEQIVDIYPCNKMILCVMAESYDVDLDELEERLLLKLIDKRYYLDDDSDGRAIV